MSLLARRIHLNIIETTPLRHRPRGWSLKWWFLVLAAAWFVARFFW